ncbi:MAG TPA: hypothetical protein VFQ85_09840 [Mycobacteriales bacterium]|jgi:hypothetical protein|nr:hypothetical protein [Mycobacteriales bacterium]
MRCRSLLVPAVAGALLAGGVPAHADDAPLCSGFPRFPQYYACVVQWNPELLVPDVTFGPNDVFCVDESQPNSCVLVPGVPSVSQSHDPVLVVYWNDICLWVWADGKPPARTNGALDNTDPDSGNPRMPICAAPTSANG